MSVVLCGWDAVIVDVLQKHCVSLVIIADAWDRAQMDLSSLSASSQVLPISGFNDIHAVFETAVRIQQSVEKTTHVLNLFEERQYAASIFCTVLSVSSLSISSALQSRDKRAMKAAALQAGVPVAASMSIYDFQDPELANKLEAKIGYPMVVKPASLFGTLGVKRLHDREVLDSWISTQSRVGDGLQSNYLAEEFIAGEEHNVDIIWQDGEIRHLFVGRYETPLINVASGTGYNTTIYLKRKDHETLFERLGDACRRFVLEIGFSNGITHAEFFVASTGSFTLNEIATRVAGGGMDPCIRELCGSGLKELTIYSLLGIENVPAATTTFDENVGFINLCPVSSGSVESLPCEEDLSAVCGVRRLIRHKQVGEDFVVEGSISWCIVAIVVARSEEEVRSAFHQLITIFQAHVRLGPLRYSTPSLADQVR